MSEIEKLRDALEQCQKALAMMIDPAAIRSTTVANAWAAAVAAEASAREVLRKAGQP